MSVTNTIEALKSVARALHKNTHHQIEGLEAEELNEHQFVRKFGDKVKRVHYSKRVDMVGLLILGKTSGIWITKGDDGFRRVRVVETDKNGVMHVTRRYVQLKDGDSLTNMQPGLLRWVT